MRRSAKRPSRAWTHPAIVRSVSRDMGNNMPIPETTMGYESATRGAAEKEGEQHRLWAMLSHMTALCVLTGIPFGNILAPLSIWLWKRRTSPLVDANGKESLNFQISLTLYGIASLILCLVLIGFVLLVVIAIADVVLVIMASLKADKGEIYRYPLTLRIIR